MTLKNSNYRSIKIISFISIIIFIIFITVFSKDYEWVDVNTKIEIEREEPTKGSWRYLLLPEVQKAIRENMTMYPQKLIPDSVHDFLVTPLTTDGPIRTFGISGHVKTKETKWSEATAKYFFIIETDKYGDSFKIVDFML